MLRSFYKVKKERDFLFSQYIYIYLSIDIYICISIYRYIYLYIYIEHSAFFCKRTKRSRILLHFLRSFMFFAKEHCVLLGFISHQKLQPCKNSNPAIPERKNVLLKLMKAIVFHKFRNTFIKTTLWTTVVTQIVSLFLYIGT